MSIKKTLFSIACVIIIFSTMIFFIRHFNMTWVSVNEDQALITINFLLPMENQDMKNYIQIENNPMYDNHYTYEVIWINKHTCEITLIEHSEVKGQKINVHIMNLPTRYKAITKSLVIPVQFKTEIALEIPEEEILIATNQSILVNFNTPMDEQRMNQYIESSGSFEIKPVISSQNLKNLTQYELIPKETLINDKEYTVTFKKGMPSIGGTILNQDQKLYIKTDQRPQISNTYPSHGDKWIGFYPRIVVESSTPMTKSFVILNEETLKGTLKTEYYSIFYPSHPLVPNTTYTMEVFIQSATGENSDRKQVTFTTAPIKEERVWIEILTGEKQILNVYRGQNQIQSFICSTSEALLGTYYTNGKLESYNNTNYGANYCTQLTEGIKIHGLMRNEYWEINSSSYINLGNSQENFNVTLSDEDAKWLFENIPDDTVVIVHPGNNQHSDE